jgi:hypothetical protein
MITRVVTVLGALVIFMVGGCERTDRPVVSSPPEDTSTSTFLVLLRGDSYFDQFAPEDLVTWGRWACSALDAGATRTVLHDSYAKVGWPKGKGPEITRASVRAFCPAYARYLTKPLASPTLEP